jgi:hypothetical protein
MERGKIVTHYTEGDFEPVMVTSLPCEDIVLRALLKRNWCHEDTKRIKADAFIRDPKRDLDGLSVNICSKTEAASWLASFSRSFGADTLHTGSIRDIDRDLNVGQAEEDAETYPEHAIITGLPFSDDDPERAEILASRLVEISRTFDRTMRKK